MRRLQLFEILDQAWCPRAVRHGATDYLEAITSRGNVYRSVQAEFFRAIMDCGAERVIDLCSGGGGPWLSPGWRATLVKYAPLAVVLTDKFPSDVLSARLGVDPCLSCVSFPVDAACVPESLRGFRTIFSSFHHFPDTIARDVLGDAVRCGEGFAMAEVTSRTLGALATMLLMPIFDWILTPRMRPFRWSRLLFTYLFPLIPLVVLWDGIVSCLRTRTPEELLILTSSFPQFDWTAGYAQGGWLAPVYLIGVPKASPKRVPQGRLSVAQDAVLGLGSADRKVPQGRLKVPRTISPCEDTRDLFLASFSRPCGTELRHGFLTPPL